MKTRTISKIVLMLMISVTTVMMMDSCKKDSNTPGGGSNNDTTAANLSASSTVADNAYDDVFQTAVQAGYDNNIAYRATTIGEGQVQVNATHGALNALGTEGVSACVSYVVNPADLTTFPKTIEVNFGAGCTSPSGITRKGKITYIYSGLLINPGTTVSATFTDYSVNDYKLEGTYSITNNSSLANGIAFTTSATNGSITYPNQTKYTYTGNKTVTQTAGATTTMDTSDDIFSIVGTNTFGNNGNTLVNTVTKALTKAYTCKYVGSGVISFTYNTNTKGTLDFGNGNCDGDVTIKVGGYTGQVTFQ